MKFREQLLNIKNKHPNKKACIIIGSPVEHSLSPAMHNEAYRSLNIDSEFIFNKINVEKDELDIFMNELKSFNLQFSFVVGLTCTMPHKETIQKHLDCIENEARIIKAVNTVKIQRDSTNIKKNEFEYIGYNTDWYGIEGALINNDIDIQNKRVVIIGAGGASRSAIYAFQKNDCQITIINRTSEKAESLAKEFNCNYAEINDSKTIQSANIIINTTNVGMGDYSNQTPINTEYLQDNQVIFECIYKPYETLLLKQAKAKGLKVVYGKDMLLYQGVMQFEKYIEKTPNINSMKNVL